MDGECSDVVAEYLRSGQSEDEHGFTAENPLRETKSATRMTDGRLLSADGTPAKLLISGHPTRLEIDYTNPEDLRSFKLRIIIRDSDGVSVFALQNNDCGFTINATENGTIGIDIPNLPLPLGRYTVSVALLNDNHAFLDRIPNALNFEIEASSFYPTGKVPHRRFGRALLEHSWTHHEGIPTA
jgi:hypothetical protein